MDRDEWRPFLKRWSEEWIVAHDPEKDLPLDPEVVRDGWLGFEPATAEEIAALEGRLGLKLPPSLRGFLEATNGWRDAGHFVYRLGGTTEIGFLRDMQPTLIEVYDEVYDDEPDMENDVSPLLRKSVQISLEGDSCDLFLNPEDVDSHGEWAAYRLASWSGMGPEPYGSFGDLMHKLYASFHRFSKPPGETRRTWDARVEDARRSALAGEVDAPLKVFTEANEFGRERGMLLAAQMDTFLAHQFTSRSAWYGSLLGPHHDMRWLGDDPLFEAELLPLLFAEHRREPGRRSALEEIMDTGGREPGPVQLAVAEYQARVRDPGFRLRFGDAEFDRAVQAALEGLPEVLPTIPGRFRRGRRQPQVTTPPSPEAVRELEQAIDAAWRAILDAIPLWRPVGEHHIAPIVLLADDRLAETMDPERGRRLLSTPRGGN